MSVESRPNRALHGAATTTQASRGGRAALALTTTGTGATDESVTRGGAVLRVQAEGACLVEHSGDRVVGRAKHHRSIHGDLGPARQ